MKIRKENKESYWIFGKHPVFSAILNPNRKVLRIVISKNKEKAYTKILSEKLLISKKNINLETLSSPQFNKIISNGVNQGIAILVEPLELLNINDFYKKVIYQKINVSVLLSDINDPHNVGAIIRSAVAFDIKDIFLKKNRSPQDTQTVAKVASGGLDKVNIYNFGNSGITFKTLKKKGWYIIGLEPNTKYTLNTIRKEKFHFDKILIIMGSESSGISPFIKKNCDILIKIPINSGNINSLNVSCAAAITFYQINNLIDNISNYTV